MRKIPALLVLALLATACGDDDGTAVGTGGQTRPTGAGDVVVQVLVGGGFVPLEFAVTSVPTVTVLGDGTVITGAPVTAIYPGPAITPLQLVKVDAGTVDGLVKRAGELGLLEGPLEFGQPPVADAPTTTVTITANGGTITHEAYALGLLDEPGRSGGGPTRLSEKELANRRALSTFLEATQALPQGTGNQIWKPGAVAVYDLGTYTPDPQLPQRQADWPVPKLPATSRTGASQGPAATCTLFEGTEAATLLAAVEKANARTPWAVPGAGLRSLAFRPVVPGQPGCPA